MSDTTTDAQAGITTASAARGCRRRAVLGGCYLAAAPTWATVSGDRRFVDEVRSAAQLLRTRTHEWSVDPIVGPTMWLLDLVDDQTIRTPEDGAKLVARWNRSGKLCDDLPANLREAAAHGRRGGKEVSRFLWRGARGPSARWSYVRSPS